METINNNLKKQGYKIGDTIKKEDLQKVCRGITRKALKVIETKGNSWVTRIIEYRDLDTLQDLEQTVAIQILEDNYKITKNAFKIVNNYIYNYKIQKLKNVEITINENGISNLDKNSYISYVMEEITPIEKTEKNKKINIEELELTKKQLEILNIFSKMGSFGKTAEVLGITKSTVQTTISRIKNKTIKLVESVEY